MSSLFSKLKALVQSSARGPRRKKRAPKAAQEAAQEAAQIAAQEAVSVAEVTEAIAQRRVQAQVTETSPAQVARPQAAAYKPASSVAEPEPDEEQAGALEEERVVDILKGKQS